MISKDSVLRRLPTAIDKKQSLFLDGIRHSVEIASLAYNRLKRILTKIAEEQINEEERGALYTPAFLDAWAIVDAIDRFRTLDNQFPHAIIEEPKNQESSGLSDFSAIRNVRNVADHLSQRMDYVLSKKGTALGILSWCTMTSVEKKECVSCSIIPGTVGKRTGPLVNPAGKNIELPTGLITLTAGEHTADLSASITLMETRTRSLEKQLDAFIESNNLTGDRAGADLFVRATLKF